MKEHSIIKNYVEYSDVYLYNFYAFEAINFMFIEQTKTTFRQKYD